VRFLLQTLVEQLEADGELGVIYRLACRRSALIAGCGRQLHSLEQLVDWHVQ
jgi:hypothetical protein